MSYGVEELLKQRSEIDTELRKHKSPITVMFTDLAGSTRYFEKYGDTAGIEWLQRHNAIVVPVVERHGGTVVKTIGDSVMAYFTDVTQSTLAAKEIQRELTAANTDLSLETGMFVRVALHQGLGYLRGGDVFGDVVNVAARVTKVCLPSQILITESVYRAVRELPEFEFSSMGTQHLRGKTSMENLYELNWTDPETYAKIREKFPPKRAATQEELSEGRYQVLGELGHGAMGVVYKAYDRVIGRVVAMKTIPLEISGEDRDHLVARLKQEARAAGILDHPNIITVFDFGEVSGLFYFTMQYVEGETFSAILSRKDLLPLEKLLGVMDQICSAVAFAHSADIIHRDLKPSNLMYTKSGVAKVLDFGIAKLGDAGLTKAGMIVGTPSYLSPEQAAGRRLDHRSDIFSLGAVFYELVTGERAFPGDSTTGIIYKVINEDPIPPIAIEPTVPSGLDAAIRKALAKDPDQRFQSCEEMREAIKNCRTSSVKVPVRQPVAPASYVSMPVATPAPSPSSSKTGWIIVAAVVLAVLGALTIPLLHREPPSNPAPAAQTSTTPATPTPVQTSPTTTAAEPTSSAGTVQNAAQKEDAAPENVPASAKKSKNKAHEKAVPEEEEPAPSGSGVFSRSDIPSLLEKADAYAGSGQYQKAIFVYQEILRVDSKNSAARDGLRRSREAQAEHR